MQTQNDWSRSGRDLPRQSIYSRPAGYEDVDDAERLRSFETETLAEEEGFAGLARINRALIGTVEAVSSPQRIVLDMDSTEIPGYGQQKQSAHNSHF